MATVYRYSKHDIVSDQRPIAPGFATLPAIERIEADAIMATMQTVDDTLIDDEGFYTGPPLEH